MSKISDKKKKEIIAYYVEVQNYRETARKFNIAPNTVKNLVKKNEDIAQICTQKKEENTKSVLQAMDDRAKDKILLIDKILKAIDKKLDDVDKFTNVKDLATAYGIILDKEIKVKELENKNKDNQDVMDRLDKLLEEQRNA